MDRDDLSRAFNLNPPADPNAISDAESALGESLPTDYKALLGLTNGLTSSGNLFILEVEDIAGRNADYEVTDYMPEFVMFRDDGGGVALVMKRDAPQGMRWTWCHGC